MRATLLVLAAIGCVTAGIVVAVLLDRDSAPSRANAYPAEVRALGMDLGMSTAELRSFGTDECQAAREAGHDNGATLLRFKAEHVAAAYNRNDQRAIEEFRVLYRGTAHLLCPDVTKVIFATSGVLL
jgi:hypothetical protein